MVANIKTLLADNAQGDAAAIIRTVEQLARAELFDLGNGKEPQFAVVPDGKKLESLRPLLDEWRDHPERREGTAHLTTLDGFIEHFQRFRNPDSIIFLDDADPLRPSLQSVIDYHKKGPDGEARFMRHRGVYAFPMSEPWKAWAKLAGKPISQEDFADFVEDHLTEIMAPELPSKTLAAFAHDYRIPLASPAALLELSRGLSLRVEQRVVSHVNPSSGEARLSFEETHKGENSTEDVRVPRGFGISIPVFRNEAPYCVPVRLRYKIVDKRPVFTFVLHRTDLVFEDALIGASEKVMDKTKVEPLRGRPES